MYYSGIKGYGLTFNLDGQLIDREKICNFMHVDDPDNLDMDIFFEKLKRRTDGWFLNWNCHSLDKDCILFVEAAVPWDMSDFTKSLTWEMVNDEIVRVLGPFLKDGVTEGQLRKAMWYVDELEQNLVLFRCRL